MDPAERRLRAAMIEPRTGGMCRYCGHHFDSVHCGSWCASCYDAGVPCPSATLLNARQRERENARVTR